jgi:hypothetical protein
MQGGRMLNPAHDDQAPENRALAALPKMPSVSMAK